MQQQHLKIKTNSKTHIAIMRKSWGLTDKILSKTKTIESRWYEHKHEPWDNIFPGDQIYFKNSGEPVSIRAEVTNVIQFNELDQEKIKKILIQYAEADGIEKSQITDYYERFKNKKYCILVFLKNASKITPFRIDKHGFGTMSAWLVVDDIEKIKIPIKNKVVQKKMF